MNPSCLTALAHATMQDFMVALVLKMKCALCTAHALTSCNINKALDTSQVRFDTATYEVQSVLLHKYNVLLFLYM